MTKKYKKGHIGIDLLFSSLILSVIFAMLTHTIMLSTSVTFSGVKDEVRSQTSSQYIIAERFCATSSGDGTIYTSNCSFAKASDGGVEYSCTSVDDNLVRVYIKVCSVGPDFCVTREGYTGLLSEEP